MSDNGRGPREGIVHVLAALGTRTSRAARTTQQRGPLLRVHLRRERATPIQRQQPRGHITTTHPAPIDESRDRGVCAAVRDGGAERR